MKAFIVLTYDSCSRSPVLVVLAPVVETVGSTIDWINHYPLFKQLGPGQVVQRGDSKIHRIAK